MKPKHVKWIAVGILALALIIWIAWGNKALVVSEYKIESERIPESFSGYRIAQVSDLHNAKFGKDNEKLITMLSATDPDIIVITGDLVDSRHTNMDVALDFAAEAVKTAPTYYVSGNHEERLSDYDELKKGLTKAGVVVLEHERVKLTKGTEQINLLGIDDPNFLGTADYTDDVDRKISALMSDDDYSVLLSHRPELFDIYVENGIDLALTGHAHGGQFRLPFIGAVAAPQQGLFPEYTEGVYTEGQTDMIVSRGLGNSMVPFRINNRPEIVVAELISK